MPKTMLELAHEIEQARLFHNWEMAVDLLDRYVNVTTGDPYPYVCGALRWVVDTALPSRGSQTDRAARLAGLKVANLARCGMSHPSHSRITLPRDRDAIEFGGTHVLRLYVDGLMLALDSLYVDFVRRGLRGNVKRFYRKGRSGLVETPLGIVLYTDGRIHVPSGVTILALPRIRR